MSSDNASVALRGLDSSQLEAARNIDGPVLIVAGAGSGKTRVLTSRIAYLLERGCEPAGILALTFTKKAAGEMKERISAMVGGRKSWRIHMGTFHSVFIRFLREFADKLGYPVDFTIYDTSDSQSAIKRCIKDLGLDDKVYKPKDVLSRISMAKNNLVGVEEYRRNVVVMQNDAAAKKPRIVDIYGLYQQRMMQSGVMDFDDILMNMALLMHKFPDVAEELSARFMYILVDEYQDTNKVQYVILRELAKAHGNICVVGDDSQSIYSFRGARIENILNFRKDFRGAKVFRLERNYRSTKNIVEAANTLIAKNADRIPKHCFSSGDDGDKIRLVEAYTELEEGALIASSIISRMERDKAEYQDFAILYRTNAQSRALEEALRKRNLPYMIYSGNSFFDRAEVKDMMAYFKLAVNPDDDESFRRVVNTPARGIGQTTVEKLSAMAGERKMSMYRLISGGGLHGTDLKGAAVARLEAFADMICRYSMRQRAEGAFTVAAALTDECGLYRMYKEDNTVESQSRAGNISELLNSVQAYVEDCDNEYVEEKMAAGEISSPDEVQDGGYPVVSLAGWLEDVSLLSAVDVKDDETSNRIALMTVHSAKGLEFPYVYVAGMEENLFPVGGFMATPKDLEEERRLFYVAMTRAEKAVVLTYAVTRMRNGKHEANPPSRFLREIDDAYVQNPLPKDKVLRVLGDDDAPGKGRSFGFKSGRNYGGSWRGGKPFVAKKDTGSMAGKMLPSKMPERRSVPPRTPDKYFVPSSPLMMHEGQRVEHNRFGFGRILQIIRDGGQLKARVAFDDSGEKTILLQYAKMRVVE